MTFEEAKKIISWIRYKPNFEIQLFPWTYNGSDYMLRVVMNVPGRDDLKPIDVRSMETFTGQYFDKLNQEGLVAIVRRLLHRMELHEADEFITFKGQRVFDPHLEENK